jgi:D-proline reductase (dithiol) PrdB
MARLDDIPEPTRSAIVALDVPAAAGRPFVSGPALAGRRVAVVTSAALHRRGEAPFPAGSGEVRVLPASLPASELVMSHVSINFDRTGWSRDANVAYPLDRLRELAADGTIGSVADSHYSVMGSTDPRAMVEAADAMAQGMRAEGVDAVLLCPV